MIHFWDGWDRACEIIWTRGKVYFKKEIIPVTQEDRRKKGFHFIQVKIRKLPLISGKMASFCVSLKSGSALSNVGLIICFLQGDHSSVAMWLCLIILRSELLLFLPLHFCKIETKISQGKKKCCIAVLLSWSLRQNILWE